MRHLTLIVSLTLVIAGCSGLEIKTLGPADVKNAHADEGKRPQPGYIVYGPMLLVMISEVETCLGKQKENGDCEGPVAKKCALSEPILFPDSSRPFLVRSKNGLGKAGVDVTILDGWRLGSFKDESDNTALLAAVEKLAIARNTPSKTTCKVGLYRWDTTAGSDPLVRVPLLEN